MRTAKQARYKQQVCTYGEQWEDIGTEDDGSIQTWPSRSEAEEDLEDMFTDMTQSKMTFSRADYRIRKVFA